MAQKKAHEVDAWIARPDPRISLVLLYGPDRGLVSERAMAIAAKAGVALDDPFSVVKIDTGTSETEPGRILSEARTISMFAERRLIWLRNAGNQKWLVDDLAELAARPPPDTFCLVEAGDLKKGAALRTVFEEAPFAMALPCYADESKMIDQLIDAEMQRSHLSISPEARQALRDRLGGDRLASRAELEKLALYALGGDAITEIDIAAVVGDVAGVSSDEMIEAVLAGRREEFADLFTRTITTSAQVQPLLAVALRQFQILHGLRASMESTRASVASAVNGLRPAPYGPRRTLIERALTQWSLEACATALQGLQQAVLESRRRADLSVAIAERILLSLAGKPR